MFSITGLTTSDRLFFLNDTATTEIYTLSLHDALPISVALAVLTIVMGVGVFLRWAVEHVEIGPVQRVLLGALGEIGRAHVLQSRQYLVCRLLLEKKKIVTVCIDLLTLTLVKSSQVCIT